ncbi:MAG TPA: hypothetical protein VLC95_10975, partial [Anaerolineae bacterium]|nr:hypothetical protein [Anaerolineae bacterium]
MSSWRDHPFHALLLLTEKPAGWPAPVVWLLPVALAAAVGMAGNWGMAAGLLLLGLADWALLASLPRCKLSFGPWQPPFLALSLVR